MYKNQSLHEHQTCIRILREAYRQNPGILSAPPLGALGGQPRELTTEKETDPLEPLTQLLTSSSAVSTPTLPRDIPTHQLNLHHPMPTHQLNTSPMFAATYVFN